MEGLWKTHYVPGGFSNVNLHALPAVAHSPTIYLQMEGSLAGSSADESLRLFFTLLVQGHLPYTSTLTQRLPSRGARSSITPLAAPDTVEKGTDDSQDPALNACCCFCFPQNGGGCFATESSVTRA